VLLQPQSDSRTSRADNGPVPRAAPLTLPARLSISGAVPLLATFVFLCGAVNIVSALILISPPRLQWLHENLPLEVLHGSRSLVVLAGLLEMALSWSLLRRKRRGWALAVILLASSTLLHLVKGLDIEEAALSSAACCMLVACRRQFTVGSDRFAAAQALWAVLLFFVTICAYGVLGLWLLRRHFTPDFSVDAALQTTLAQLYSAAPLSLQPLPYARDARWLLDSLDFAAVLGIIYATALFFAPVAQRLGRNKLQPGRAEVLALLHRFRGQPQSYFMLMPGISYLFNTAHTSVVGYRVVHGVAIALRDPIGPEEELDGLLTSFRQRCFTRDWIPCFLAGTSEHLAYFKQQGWHCLKIGEEALVDLPGLSFAGKSWQDVRTALHRLPREGYSAQWYDIGADPHGWREALERISDVWLAQQRGGELGFTLGTWELAVQFAAEQRMLVLVNSAGQPAAFMTFIPCYVQGGGWSLDLMRKAGNLPPGSMEFLLATAIRQFQADGCGLLSLSLAPLADLTEGDQADAPEIVERARQLVFDYFGLTYNFRGLAHFKAKFSPRWEPRYLIYPSVASLPRIFLALLRAHRA
jgi:phosphatidylglycerol lysyltransferase